MSHIREYTVEPCQLYLFNDGLVIDDRPLLRYEFYYKDKLMFKGINYCPNSLYPLDSDQSVANLLGFLSLRPGDTDINYFKNYTVEQLHFVMDHGDNLILLQESLLASC